MVYKQAAEDEELKEQMAKAREEARQELTQKREVGDMRPKSHRCTMAPNLCACSQLHLQHAQARVQPQTHAELVEYLLDTEGDEMTFEVARCRPLLTEDFFDYLKGQVGGSAKQQCTGFACALP